MSECCAETVLDENQTNQTSVKTGKMNDIYLTNRFHVAVRLLSDRSQMTSKCSKNKQVAHEPLGECVTDVLTTF